MCRNVKICIDTAVDIWFYIFNVTQMQCGYMRLSRRVSFVQSDVDINSH